MRDRTASPGFGFSNRPSLRHDSATFGVNDANRPVTGARIMYPDWPFSTCRPSACHCLNPATYEGAGSGTRPASNAA